MKKIELKSDNGLDYAEQIRVLVSAAPRGAEFDLSDMRKSIRVMDALDSARLNVLLLEDSDWEYLKHRTELARFSIAHKSVLEMVDSILSAESVSKDYEIEKHHEDYVDT